MESVIPLICESCLRVQVFGYPLVMHLFEWLFPLLSGLIKGIGFSWNYKKFNLYSFRFSLFDVQDFLVWCKLNAWLIHLYILTAYAVTGTPWVNWHSIFKWQWHCRPSRFSGGSCFLQSLCSVWSRLVSLSWRIDTIDNEEVDFLRIYLVVLLWEMSPRTICSCLCT